MVFLFGKNLKLEQRNKIIYNLISSSKPIVDMLIEIVMQLYIYYAIILCKINQENNIFDNEFLATNVVNAKLLAKSSILSKCN